MNRSMETFLSEVNSRKAKRRRMTALLLSLSFAVTSGVSWALRGVGLTLANDAECGIGEHLHTDDCYEQVLVCGLEEDETHTHGDACYEMQLVCGLEEHIHDTGCFLGGDAEDGAVLLRGTEAEDATDEDDAEPAAVPPKPVLRAPGDGAPSTVSTIDNIAEGIKFTLFDYGGTELESQNNRYVYRWDDENHVWTHPQAYSDDELGWKDSGINSGRDPSTDILFFAMGTPVDSYCHDPDVYNYIDDNGVQHYKPDMNSYAGDYYANPVYSGNRPVSGIVDHQLGDDGYPKIAASGNSLAYLFAPNTYDAERGVDQSEYKTVYTDVNHLLQRDQKGHLFYTSNEYYAYFNQDTGNFDVYDGTYRIINKDHHMDGDTDNIKYDSEGNPVVYSGDLNWDFQIGFFPFDQYDDTRRDPNFDGNGYNHHFGMTMEAEFTNPSKANVTDPITFEYSGDDDMWVFVDDNLVLDLGGIHEPAGGMIDFTNGLVWTQDNGNDGYTLDEVRAQLESRGVIHNDAEWTDLPKPSLGADTSGTGNKWIVKQLSDPDVYPGWDSVAHTQTHKISMFYLERGGCYSNLSMAMNLPTLRPLTVMKNVDYQQHLVKGIYEDLDYSFQVWEWDKVNGIWVIPQDTDPNGDFYLPGSAFTLKDGQRKTFEGLGQERKFKVEEKGVDPNIFEAVEVNGSPVDVLDGSAATAGAVLNEMNSYTFKNKIIEETEPLRIRKVWEPENAQPPPGFDKVKFKITRTDDKTGEEKRVALVIDGVKVRTFAMTAEEWTEGVTFDGMLSRYGDHTYSYTVDELNVPRSFKVSYSTDASGAIVITNTDSKETDIYVKKKWENTAAPEPKIKLRLTRQRLRYEGSKPTQLTINILDEAGNPLMSYTTPAQVPGETYKGVYAGGGAEFSYQLPDGVEFYADDPAYPVMTPAASAELQNPPTFKFHEDEGIVVVENLAATPNTLTFKVRTADAEDSLLLLHHSFSEADPEKTQGWGVQNPAEANSSATAAYDGSDSYGKDGGSLLISNRVRANNAAVLKLDPVKFNGNKTYTFSAYVYSPVEDQFKMTFSNGLGGYQPIGEVTVPANTWTQITGTIQLPAEIDPYNMALMIESLPVGGDYTNFPLTEGGTWFRVDEFTAIEGTRPVTVSADDGTVTVDNGAGSGGEGQVVYEIQFNDTTGDWVKNPGNSNVQLVNEHDNDNGFHYVAVRGRNGTGDGMRLSVPFLQKGHTYRFESFVQGDGNNNNSRVQLTIDTINGSEDGTGDQSRWQNIGGATVSNWQPGEFSETFTIPNYADLDGMYLYYETAYGSNDNASFRVHSLRITDLTASSSPTPSDMDEQPGYDIVDDRYYVSNFDLYRIIPDENSITDPVNPSPEGYQPEENWSKEIILPDDSDDGASWTYHWDNDRSRPPNDPHRINEDPAHYLYKYEIEEIAIMKDGENWVEIDGTDEDYLISYLNNGTATNTEDNPIVVKNTYIWYRLPETGGTGTDMFYGAGLFLITTGLIGGYAFRRRERRFR